MGSSATQIFFFLKDCLERIHFQNYFTVEGKSCQDIRQKFPNLKLVDGEYQLTNGTGKFLFKAYCDMNFDEGKGLSITLLSNT